MTSQLLCPCWSVQHYASMGERKRLEPGVAGARYKPVCSVDRADFREEDQCSSWIPWFISPYRTCNGFIQSAAALYPPVDNDDVCFEIPSS